MKPAYFEAIERDANTGEVLSIFRTDSRDCDISQAYQTLADMIGANIDETRCYEVRRYDSEPANWGARQ